MIHSHQQNFHIYFIRGEGRHVGVIPLFLLPLALLGTDYNHSALHSWGHCEDGRPFLAAAVLVFGQILLRVSQDIPKKWLACLSMQHLDILHCRIKVLSCLSV